MHSVTLQSYTDELKQPPRILERITSLASSNGVMVVRQINKYLSKTFVKGLLLRITLAPGGATGEQP